MHSKLLTTILIAAPLILSSIPTAEAAFSGINNLIAVTQQKSNDANDPPPPPPPPPKPISTGSQSDTGSSTSTITR